jgi:hypothetical protein
LICVTYMGTEYYYNGNKQLRGIIADMSKQHHAGCYTITVTPPPSQPVSSRATSSGDTSVEIFVSCEWVPLKTFTVKALPKDTVGSVKNTALVNQKMPKKLQSSVRIFDPQQQKYLSATATVRSAKLVNESRAWLLSGGV